MSSKKIRSEFKFLGEGISRRVYAINDNFVVKVAKGNEGIYQNRVEYFVYTHAGNNFEIYLCPIVWYQPDRLIMRRAVPLSRHHKSKYVNLSKIRPERSAYSDLNKLASSFYLFYEDIISTSSWGILNSNAVLIDYGCTSYRGDMFYNTLFKQ